MNSRHLFLISIVAAGLIFAMAPIPVKEWRLAEA